MTTHHGAFQPSETFQTLLLRLRGRTGLTQRQLAAGLGMHRRSIQGWESGSSYPNDVSLRALLAAYLAANAFSAGRESAEAAAVWTAAVREAPRRREGFDGSWFADLLGQRAADSRGTRPARRQDWGDAPSIASFRGRVQELEELQRCVLAERCRVVALLGMAGIGKTMLAARLAEAVAPEFERIVWRSLRDAPPFDEWLAGVITFIADQPVALSTGEVARLRMLLGLLQTRRCLLVLDNFETILELGERVGTYRAGYAGYGRLVHELGEREHRSCLLVTSREAAPELGSLGGRQAIRVFDVQGLDVEQARTLLQDKVLRGDVGAWARLTDRYAGNPLALRIAAESIRRVFGGDIAAFLRRDRAVFGGVRRMLDEQFGRLAPAELATLRWLAIEREPVSLEALAADLGPEVSGATLIETLESLRGRSLLAQHSTQDNAFTLPSVVVEYVTDRLVEDVTRELVTQEPRLLLSHALVKATAKDYVRRSQERLIAGPVLAKLIVAAGEKTAADDRIRQQLNRLRSSSLVRQGYGPGNLANLLRLLCGNLRHVDLSGLSVRQAYLQDVEAQDASLAGAHLHESLLAEGFAYPNAVALSADGAYLATGSVKGELHAWRVADRTAVLAVAGHAGPVLGLALSGDGRLIASGGLDGLVKVWETTTGRLRASMRAHPGGVWGLALSRDGRLLASGSGDGEVTLWHTESEEPVAKMAGHSAQVWGVALSGDGRRLASSSLDVIRLWDTDTGRLLTTLPGHSGEVMGVALSEAGDVLASGGHDGTVRVWQTEGGERQAILNGNSGQVYRVGLSADGRLLASAGHDGTVKLWTTEDGTLQAILRGHTGQVYGVSLSGDGRLVASGGQDGTVKLWDPTGRLLASIQGWGGGVRGVSLSANGHLVASAGADAAVRLWDGGSGRLLATLPGYTSLVPAVSLSDDGRLIVTGETDGTIKFWDTVPPRLLTAVLGHSGLVSAVALSQDGRIVVSAGIDERVRVWDGANGLLLTSLMGHRGGIRAVALSADGRLAASAGQDRTVRLWQVRSGELLATLEGHTGPVFGVSLSADGRLVASSGLDASVRLWSAPLRRLVTTLHGDGGPVWAVALSRDGRLLVSGSQDGAIRLWDARSSRLLATLYGHSDGVWAVAVSGDGQLVASGSIDGTLRLWDVATGATLRTLRGDRRYARLDITGLTGVTPAQRDSLIALGARDERTRELSSDG